MAPVNNFFQFDEDLNNIMGTFDYSNNLTRIGGLLKGKASSNLHNKLFYQVSTMVAGIGQMMCNKGYDMDDSSISTLITQLSNIMTQADMSIYSTTAQMMAAIASALGSYSTTSQMNTAIANAIKGLGGDNLTVAQVNALISSGVTSIFLSGLNIGANGGEQILPGGLILQFGKYTGQITTETTIAISFSPAFPNSFLFGDAIGIGSSNSADWWIQIDGATPPTKNGMSVRTQNEGASQSPGHLDGFYWFAIGK